MTGEKKKRAPRRRGFGEGSIFQREDGRWYGQVSLGMKNGKRLRRNICGKIGETKQQVLDRLTRLQHKKSTNSLEEPSKITTEQFLEHWLVIGAGDSVAGSTLLSYRTNLRVHVYPQIGGVRVQKLGAMHIQTVLSSMMCRKIRKRGNSSPLKPASARSKQYVYTILKRAFAAAVQWKVIASNPCDGVQRPAFQKFEISPLNAEQARKFIAAAQDSPLYLFFLLAMQTGARTGELRALKMSDVNFREGTLSIQRTVSKTAEGLIEKQPKTSKGRRLVTLPKDSIDALHDLKKERFQSGIASDKLIFTSQNGGFLDNDLMRTEFDRILRTAGLPAIRPHDLRHTHATLLLLQGVHPKIVQERLGHATIAITLDTYSHVLPSLQSEVSQKINELFA